MLKILKFDALEVGSHAKKTAIRDVKKKEKDKMENTINGWSEQQH